MLKQRPAPIPDQPNEHSTEKKEMGEKQKRKIEITNYELQSHSSSSLYAHPDEVSGRLNLR